VPVGWEKRILADACASLEDGDWIESKDQGGEDYRLLQISNIGLNEFVETGNFRYVAEETFKRLNCRELLPGNHTIGMLVNPNSPNTEGERRDVQAAAHAIGQKLMIVDVSTEADLEPAFAAMARQGVAGLLSGTGGFMNSQRERLVSLAARHAIPAIYAEREFAEVGGLMSLGGSITQAYRQAGVYAGRILRGERPGELPVIQVNKVDFVLNMRTARTLKLAIPPALAFQADEVIE
jgi:putative ABC transport system substrate-binding protein